MDFVTIRDLRVDASKVWEKLETERELVVTRNGKPFALLTTTRPNTVEQDLKTLRQARAQAAVAAMQRRAAKLGLDKMTLAEINSEITATRRERRKKQGAPGR